MCCGRPHPCLVLSHHSKKITPGLFVMVCADIALGLITPAFSVALFLAGSWTWGGTCGRSRIYGISGEACGCLFFKCNIRPWATTYIVLKNVEESHMAYILGRFFLPLLCMLLHVRFFFVLFGFFWNNYPSLPVVPHFDITVFVLCVRYRCLSGSWSLFDL